MGVWDRLGNVIKSYLNDYGEEVFHGSSPRGGYRDGRYRSSHSDPDLNAAYEELDDFLGNNKDRKKTADEEPQSRPIPKELLKDFEELGLTPEVSFEECKAAYKKLLKIHHPDKHSTHEANMKKATEKSSRVNASYKRLEIWFKANSK